MFCLSQLLDRVSSSCSARLLCRALPNLNNLVQSPIVHTQPELAEVVGGIKDSEKGCFEMDTWTHGRIASETCPRLSQLLDQVTRYSSACALLPRPFF